MHNIYKFKMSLCHYNWCLLDEGPYVPCLVSAGPQGQTDPRVKKISTLQSTIQMHESQLKDADKRALEVLYISCPSHISTDHPKDQFAMSEKAENQ